MKNKYGLPEDELLIIRNRDIACAYCGKEMKPYVGVRGCPPDKATIEHLNENGPWNDPKLIVICCGSCNASRGNKSLNDWFASQYCVSRDIGPKTVSVTVKNYLLSL